MVMRKISHVRVAALLSLGASFAAAQHSAAQSWSGAPNGIVPMIGAQLQAPAGEQAMLNGAAQSATRGPLARLVHNPDESGTSPPYALTDQYGTVQRYVEPVPGIDLDPHVGQVVTVRHDTGKTLLASQLELPPAPLYPLVGTANRFASLTNRDSRAENAVRQAQHVDHDDSTVELLSDGEELPNGDGPHPAAMPGEIIYPDGQYPMSANGPMMPGMDGTGCPGPGCDPMNCGPQAYGAYPAQFGGGPCPQCGGYHQQSGYIGELGSTPQYAAEQQDRPHVYAEVEINFMRAHIMEDTIGKLSEKYEFSPRFIVGFTGVGNLDGRIRYWTYGRTNRTLEDDQLRLEFDVLDFEATHLFTGRRSEILIGGGLRLARIELEDTNDSNAGCDLMGITMAADGRTPLLTLEAGQFGWVYGGRVSILAGDWGGEPGNMLVDGRVRDDNVMNHELYAGLELARSLRGFNVHAQLAFEMQNWHSDVLAERADTDSISFVGPGLRLGAEF